jgi:hypothetical protein
MLWDAQARPPPSSPPSALPDGGPLDTAALTAFAHDHALAWESAPRYEWRDGRRLPVGYDVAVFARHPLGLADDPSSARNAAFRRRFDEWLAAAVPPARDGLVCRRRDQPLRLVLRRENDWVPEIEARVEVRHAASTFEPSDEAEKRCLHEVEARLRRLGAQTPVHDDGRRAVRGARS